MLVNLNFHTGIGSGTKSMSYCLLTAKIRRPNGPLGEIRGRSDKIRLKTLDSSRFAGDRVTQTLEL